MFSSRRHHRVATALLEVAEAMLRPAELEDDRSPAGDDAWQWPARQQTSSAEPPRPHRRASRIERPRRPGAPAHPAQHCTAPQPPRSQRTARPAAA